MVNVVATKQLKYGLECCLEDKCCVREDARGTALLLGRERLVALARGTPPFGYFSYFLLGSILASRSRNHSGFYEKCTGNYWGGEF